MLAAPLPGSFAAPDATRKSSEPELKLSKSVLASDVCPEIPVPPQLAELVALFVLPVRNVPSVFVENPKIAVFRTRCGTACV